MEPELGSAVQAQAAAIAGLLKSLGRPQRVEFAGAESGTDNPNIPLAAGVSDAIANFVRQSTH